MGCRNHSKHARCVRVDLDGGWLILRIVLSVAFTVARGGLDRGNVAGTQSPLRRLGGVRRLARRRLGAHAVPAAAPDMTLHRVSYDDETAYAYAYFDGDRPGNQDKVADC